MIVPKVVAPPTVDAAPTPLIDIKAANILEHISPDDWEAMGQDPEAGRAYLAGRGVPADDIEPIRLALVRLLKEIEADESSAADFLKGEPRHGAPPTPPPKNNDFADDDASVPVKGVSTSGLASPPANYYAPPPPDRGPVTSWPQTRPPATTRAVPVRKPEANSEPPVIVKAPPTPAPGAKTDNAAAAGDSSPRTEPAPTTSDRDHTSRPQRPNEAIEQQIDALRAELDSKGYNSNDPERFLVGFNALIGRVMMGETNSERQHVDIDIMRRVNQMLRDGATPAEIREDWGEVMIARVWLQIDAKETAERQRRRREAAEREESERHAASEEKKRQWEADRAKRTVITGPRGGSDY
ncbi:MAG: hypothetical protein HZC25_04355 [Rhodospirillales bacterium]|nr:hypothetical protein [Rhodospirillales bacterium]